MSVSLSVPLLGWLSIAMVHAQSVHGVIDGAPFELLSSVEAAGDVNHDGIEDLLVVKVRDPLTGGPGPFQVLSGATLAALGPAIAAELGSTAGHVVRTIGDFDGDGTPDFARLNQASQPMWSVQFFSGATWAQFQRLDVASDPTWGAELAPLGDCDGDGLTDVTIVQRAAGFGDFFAARAHRGPDGARTVGIAIGSYLSSHWQRYDLAGDVDGDGRSDILAFHYRDPLYFGLPEGYAFGITYSLPHQGSPGYNIAGRFGDYTEGFGHHATVIADLNQDGKRDLAVGAPGRVDIACCVPGRVDILLSTGFGQPIFRSLYGVDDGTSASHGSLGTWLDGSRDLDGDGITDLLVSAPGANAQRGYVDAYKLPDFTLLWRVRPEGPMDQHARRPVFVGDLDGDGASEWAVVDPWASYGGPLSGRVWIYKGAQGGEATSFCPASVNSTGQPA